MHLFFIINVLGRKVVVTIRYEEKLYNAYKMFIRSKKQSRINLVIT